MSLAADVMCSLFFLMEITTNQVESESDIIHSKTVPPHPQTPISPSNSYDWGQDETIAVESDSEGSDGGVHEEEKDMPSRPISFKSNRSLDIDLASSPSPIMNRRLSMRTLSIYRKESTQVSDQDTNFLNQLVSIIDQFPSPPTRTHICTQPSTAKSTLPITHNLLSEGWSMISKFSRLVTPSDPPINNESAPTVTVTPTPARRPSKEWKSEGSFSWIPVPKPSQPRHSRVSIPDVSEDDYV